MTGCYFSACLCTAVHKLQKVAPFPLRDLKRCCVLKGKDFIKLFASFGSYTGK